MNRHWNVQGVIPPGEDGNTKTWRENKTLHVVAETAERACVLVRRHYPHIEIMTVMHGGKLDFIEDQP